MASVVHTLTPHKEIGAWHGRGLVYMTSHITHVCVGAAGQGGQKPGILRDFSEHGKLCEFLGNQCKLRENLYQNSIFTLSFKYLCKTAVDWVNVIINISGSSDPVQ